MFVFDAYYHIYNHANGNENLFKERKNYFFFLSKSDFHLGSIANRIAWCLMPNHFHLLIKIKSFDEIKQESIQFKELKTAEQQSNFISKKFSNFFSSYTQSYNKVYQRRGSLFLKNFKRKEIQDEKYLLNLLLYIHQNPVRHGFVNSCSDWEFSSFRNFPTENQELLELIFDDIDNYKWIHQEQLEDWEKLL